MLIVPLKEKLLKSCGAVTISKHAVLCYILEDCINRTNREKMNNFKK